MNTQLQTTGVQTRWPDFLVIGAGKSGTTSLNNYLKEHPEIFMSYYKEPNFFAYEHMTEEDFDNLDDKEYFNISVTRQADYLALFEPAEENQLIGEVSNTYLSNQDAYKNIKKHAPNVKLIAILRQPAERLYSRYLHMARDGRLPSNNFEDCLKRDSIWWERSDLVPEGFYYQHLLRYFDAFASDQLRVFLFEDLKTDPQKVMREIFNFLGVNDQFEPEVSVVYNESGFVKNKYLDSIFGRKGIFKKLVPKNIYQYLKWNKHAQQILFGLRKKNLHKPNLSADLKVKVTELYREDILSLAKLLGRNLDHWFDHKTKENHPSSTG